MPRVRRGGVLVQESRSRGLAMLRVSDFHINLALWIAWTRRHSDCGYDGKHICKWRVTRDRRALVCLVGAGLVKADAA